MADVKISALPAASAGAVADLIPIVQSGTTKYVTIANLLKVAPVIGGTTPAAGSFTTLSATGKATIGVNGILLSSNTGLAAHAADTGVIDHITSYLRFFSDGPDNATPGGFQWYAESANASVGGHAMGLTGAGNLLIGTTTETASAGLLQLATGTTAASGIVWGTDSNLYRTGAAALASNSSLTLMASLTTNATAGINIIPTVGTSGAYTSNITTGGNLYFGLENSAGTVLNTTGAYGTFIYRPASTVFAISRTTNVDLSISATGNTTLGGSIQTSAPTGGTAAAWKVGVAGSASITSPDKYVTVDVAGTLYYIPAKLTAN